MRVMRAALTVLPMLLLAACGQLGPLYFDEDPPPDQMPPSRKQTGAAPLPVPPAKQSAPACAIAPPESATTPAAQQPATSACQP